MRWQGRDEGGRLLARLGVAEVDLRELLDAYPETSRPPWWWELLQGAHDRLVDSMGRPGKVELLPEGAPALGPVERFFGVYALLSVLPDVLEWHRSHGVPEDVSWATLRDLGRQVGIYRRFQGQSGFDEFDWVSRHFRGLVFQLGRLQFEPGAVNEEWLSDEAFASAVGPGGQMLAVHIPEAGPLAPELCDAAFASARSFFPEHFPGPDYRVATCDSWLLDPQLSEYLPPEANIVRFQRRFRVLPASAPGSRAVLRFVFYKNEAVLGQLPQRTLLERAIVQHLRGGGDWYVRVGWTELGKPAGACGEP